MIKYIFGVVDISTKSGISMKITVKNSPTHGLGVFATQDVAAGETLERCAYIVIDDDDLQEVNRLNDYLFTSPDDPNDYLVVMGCGMLYNHGVPANAKWEVDETDNRFLRFYADRDIKAGEELFHDYGEEYWTTRAEDEPSPDSRTRTCQAVPSAR